MQETPDSPLDFSAMVPPSAAEVTPGRDAREERVSLEAQRVKAGEEVYRLTIHALRFAAVLLAMLVAVRLWHLAGPYTVGGVDVRWLCDEDIQSIDKMLFSSALGGLVLGHLKEIMRPLDKAES